MKTMKGIFIKSIFTATICLLFGCSGTESFTTVYGSEGPLVTYPDYKGVTIPENIAPLNYCYMMEGARKLHTTFTAGDKSVHFKGAKVEWPLSKWKSFIEGSSGKTITVEAQAEIDGQVVSDKWVYFVSEDKVDPYLTYRLIEPAYQSSNELYIMERCIENFKETVICDYLHTDNACMNCHIHGSQRGDLSMFYIRGANGGAIFNRDGRLRKLTLNADGMLSGTVYGEIHPSGRYGVFSTNIIIPGLHTIAGERMEVFDSASDLTVADFDRNLMVNVPHVAREDRWETFPCFSADGEYIFYCVSDTLSVPRDIKDVRYDLVRAAFDTSGGRISEQIDTVWSSKAHGASACHPKASPDGRWLMFTVASYGTFPINHVESTLNLIDLNTGESRALDEIKGDKSDTYHSWSSNSRWFVFASKRGDGQYGKPYFCHIDENGNLTKPFVLPQKSSRFYDFNLKSFNIPDLGKESVNITVKESAKMFKAESEVFQQAAI